MKTRDAEPYCRIYNVCTTWSRFCQKTYVIYYCCGLEMKLHIGTKDTVARMNKQSDNRRDITVTELEATVQAG